MFQIDWPIKVEPFFFKDITQSSALSILESKVQGLYFQPTSRSENIFWSYNCDFTGAVVGSVSTEISADCGEMCLSNVDCTHFMWNNHNAGTCWMKNVSTLYTPVEKYGENIHCGWVERPSKE